MFAMKPGMKSKGPPMQTPQKMEYGGQEMMDMDNGVSPPPVGYPQNDNSRTPPPHPNS
jgi:hypothetical protein